MSDKPEMTAIAINPEPATPMTLIQAAIEKGANIDNLGKLMDLQERWERNEAAKVFAEKIELFQSKMPAVVKGNPVKDKNGAFLYAFANHDDIMEIAQPILHECGITVTFSTEITPEKLMRTTCHVRVGIHVEHTSVFLALPKIPNANDAQMAGAALSYGQRYAMKAALNIRIKGEDNDAATLIVETLNEKQIKTLDDLIEQRIGYGAPKDYFPRFLKWLGVSEQGCLADVSQGAFLKAREELDRQIAKCQKESTK